MTWDSYRIDIGGVGIVHHVWIFKGSGFSKIPSVLDESIRLWSNRTV